MGEPPRSGEPGDSVNPMGQHGVTHIIFTQLEAAPETIPPTLGVGDL